MNHAITELHGIRMMVQRQPVYSNPSFIADLLGRWIDKYVKQYTLQDFIELEVLATYKDDEKFKEYREQILAAKVGADLLKTAEKRIDYEPRGERTTLRFYVIDCSKTVKE